MAEKDHEALVHVSKDSTHDQSSRINMTDGAASDSTACPTKIPETLRAAEATKLETGAEASTGGSHPQQELQRRLTAKYQYSPLADESDNIRILELLPGGRDDPIRTRLEHCLLSNRPRYEAISYAWGNKNDNAVATVCEEGRDYTVEIPKSLHGALKQLRHQFKRRSIWADAICMNQADDKEKNHQVRLMRKIYQRAKTVVIWLGYDDDIDCGGNCLFDAINRISQHEEVPPPEDRETWTALERLFKRSWFLRVWCLQEAILAPSAKIMLGEHSTSWGHVGRAARSIYGASSRIPSSDGAKTGVQNAYLMHWLSHTNKQRKVLSFQRLLALTRPFEASDCRDKIYGILGIPTTDSDPDAGEPFLEPDYTKTLPEVYIRCALTIIRKTQSLRLLSHVQHRRLPRRTADISDQIKVDDTLVNVPSWVPRWHQHLSNTFWQADDVANAFQASASMSLDPGLKIEVRGLELITYGVRAAPVKPVSRTYYSSRDLRNTAAETANEVWVKIFDRLEASTTGPTEALHALSSLLTAGQVWERRPIQDIEQHFADFLAFVYDPVMLSDGGIAAGVDQGQGASVQQGRSDGTRPGHPNMLVDSLFRPRTDLALPLTPRLGRGRYFQEAMRRACNWRRLVVTEDGRVGIGPTVTEPGDIVCILGNAPVPLVLRPEADGDKFKLVGEAYIQGMMFGEINVPEPEQIILSDKPFVSLDKVGPRDGEYEPQRDQSN